MGERDIRKGLTAEEILAELEVDEFSDPLVGVFCKLVEPKSIRFHKEPLLGERDVLGAIKDPNVDLVLRLGVRSDRARLGVYFASARLLRDKPEAILPKMPDFSVFIDPPPPRPYGGLFDEVRAKVSIHHLNLSSVSAKAFLRILEDISSRYIALNQTRREKWLRQDH